MGGLDSSGELSATLKQLLDQMETRPGFGDGRLNDNGDLVISWKSPVPTDVAALDGKRSGQAVIRVRESCSSLVELMDASEAVATNADEWLPGVFRSSGPGPGSDYLLIEVDDQPAQTEERLSTLLGVPVIIELTGEDWPYMSPFE